MADYQNIPLRLERIKFAIQLIQACRQNDHAKTKSKPASPPSVDGNELRDAIIYLASRIERLDRAEARKREIHANPSASLGDMETASKNEVQAMRDFWMQWHNVEIVLMYLTEHAMECSCHYGECWLHAKKEQYHAY